MVSRYIIVKSREARSSAHDGHRSTSPRQADTPKVTNLATATARRTSGSAAAVGTGGTSLIPFLKQARDETGSLAVDPWAVSYTHLTLPTKRIV